MAGYSYSSLHNPSQYLQYSPDLMMQSYLQNNSRTAPTTMVVDLAMIEEAVGDLGIPTPSNTTTALTHTIWILHALHLNLDCFLYPTILRHITTKLSILELRWTIPFVIEHIPSNGPLRLLHLNQGPTMPLNHPLVVGPSLHRYTWPTVWTH